MIAPSQESDFRSDNRSDNISDNRSENLQQIAENFSEILWPTYKCDELSARPLTSSQTSTCSRVMYTCVHSRSGTCHFLHPRPVTLVYIPACGRRVALLQISASLTFQRTWQQTWKTGAELMCISRYRSTNRWASVIALHVGKSVREWRR